MVHDPDRKLMVASSDGRGFVVAEREVVAQTRNGRQVLNPGADARASVCAVVTGDHVAVLGTNRKLLVFPLTELPEMTRGRGVRLQRYKDGTMADAKTFALDEGLAWSAGSRTRTFSADDLADWLGHRAQAGRLPPHGAPRAKTFG